MFRHQKQELIKLLGGFLCAISLGSAVGFLVAGQQASARTTTGPVFPSMQLMPGQHVAGHFTVSPGSATFAPWLRVADLKQGCIPNADCAALDIPLSSALHVDVTAPDGSSLETTIAALVDGKSLPGGELHPGDAARRYQAVLSMPASLPDAYEDRTLSFGMQYGPRVAVLAHHGHRGQNGNHGNQSGEVGVSSQGGALPFTGADIAMELAAALSVIAIGVMLVGAARRRHAR